MVSSLCAKSAMTGVPSGYDRRSFPVRLTGAATSPHFPESLESEMRTQVLSVTTICVAILSAPGIAQDWPMRGRTASRNPVAVVGTPPIDWSTGADDQPRRNVRWTAKLGSVTSGTPVVANGLVWVGTNNGNAPDAAVLMCFRESDGKLLYQYVSPRLPDGRNYDWPNGSLASSPLVEKNRIWFCTNQSKVVCLHIKPLIDGTGDPTLEWEVDMRKEYGVVPRSPMIGNPCSHCSPVGFGDRVYVNTGNSRQAGKVPAPNAPSMLCLDKRTGKLVWSDNTPGKNIMYAQQGNPTVFESNGQTQVAVGQGDGWIRSFDCEKGTLLWEFNINPPDAEQLSYFGSRRSYVPEAPVFYKGRLYAIAGTDPESGGWGPGRVVCLDPDKRGDVSSHRLADSGDVVPNTNSSVVWQHRGIVRNNDWIRSSAATKEEMKQIHQSVGGLAIQRDMVIAPDIEGFVHCYDAATGQAYWHYDALGPSYGSPLIVKNRIYLGLQDAEVHILALSKQKRLVAKRLFRSMIEPSPVFANGTLFVAARNRLHAIREQE